MTSENEQCTCDLIEGVHVHDSVDEAIAEVRADAGERIPVARWRLEILHEGLRLIDAYVRFGKPELVTESVGGYAAFHLSQVADLLTTRRCAMCDQPLDDDEPAHCAACLILVQPLTGGPPR